MLNSRTERKAIYTTAKFFTEIGWFFREQPILDFGIDAFVETGNKGRPSGCFIALQVKGGESNFHKSKEGLTFYFGETHRQYWQEVGKTFLVLIILQDPSDDNLYWMHIADENIIKTPKNWKVVVPYSNRLISDSKSQIEDLLSLHKESELYSTDYFYLAENLNRKESYTEPNIYFRNDPSLGLHCIINIGNLKRKLDLRYKPKKSDWDESKNELKWDHPYFHTLHDIKKYLLLKIKDESNIEIKNIVKATLEKLNFIIATGGLGKLAEFMFDWRNIGTGIPKYSSFIEAFEHFQELNNRKNHPYETQSVGDVIYFKTDSVEYIMNTFEGKTEELRFIIDNKAYDEIYTMTNKSIWSDIYLDAGIKKEEFIPVMLNLWESYWDNLYKRIKNKVGKTKHLDSSKEKSWRQFQIFSEGYRDAGDIITYAYALDEMVFYPLAVVTMMNIFNPEVCYNEYCELEFYTGNWQSVCIDDINYTKPIFHIKINEV